MSLPKDKLLEECFGWNRKAWAQPYKKYIAEFPRATNPYASALEVGAGHRSSLAPYLSTEFNQVICSYYDQSQLNQIKNRNSVLESRYGLSSPEYRNVDIMNYQGKHDFIMMKSVLGGLCRVGSGIDHQDVLNKIVENNLNDDGLLVTMDNGISVVEKYLKKFGARGKKWQFFKPDVFTGYEYQTTFGCLSFSAISSRLGSAGLLAEDAVFQLDKFIQKINPPNPVVILTVYKKKRLIDVDTVVDFSAPVSKDSAVVKETALS